MDDREQEVFQQKLKDHAKDYLFPIGQPLVYRGGDGGIATKYPDGSTEKK